MIESHAMDFYSEVYADWHLLLVTYIFFISFCLFLADCGAGVQTKIVIADFTKGSQVYEHIEKETANIPISILGK